MKFRPLHDRVVVKRIDAEEKTAGGIIIPDTAQEKPSEGEITAVGPGGRDEAGKLIPIYDPASTQTVNGVTTRLQYLGNVIPASKIDPVGLKVLDYYPLPNQSPSNIAGGNNFSHVTLLAESSRRVGTAWPGAASKGKCGARKANAKDSRGADSSRRCCAAQQIEITRIRFRGSRFERFIAATGRLVPPRRLEG